MCRSSTSPSLGLSSWLHRSPFTPPIAKPVSAQTLYEDVGPFRASRPWRNPTAGEGTLVCPHKLRKKQRSNKGGGDPTGAEVHRAAQEGRSERSEIRFCWSAVSTKDRIPIMSLLFIKAEYRRGFNHNPFDPFTVC